MFIAALFTHSGQDMETIKVSFDRQLNKEDVVHLYNGIPLSHKKDEILPFVTWIDLDNIMLSEVRQKLTTI